MTNSGFHGLRTETADDGSANYLVQTVTPAQFREGLLEIVDPIFIESERAKGDFLRQVDDLIVDAYQRGLSQKQVVEVLKSMVATLESYVN